MPMQPDLATASHQKTLTPLTDKPSSKYLTGIQTPSLSSRKTYRTRQWQHGTARKPGPMCPRRSGSLRRSVDGRSACEWDDAAAAQSRAIIDLEIRHVILEQVVRVLQTRARKLLQGVGTTQTTARRVRHRGCTCLRFTRRKGCRHEDCICEEVDG